MKNAKLKQRLEGHFEGLRRSTSKAAGNWQTYAAVTGSALAAVTSVSAQNIVYSGPNQNVAVSIPSARTTYTPLGAAIRQGHIGVANTNPHSSANVKFGPGTFAIGLSQKISDSVNNGSAFLRGFFGTGFLHNPANSFFMKHLGAGDPISAGAGAFLVGGEPGLGGRSFVAAGQVPFYTNRPSTTSFPGSGCSAFGTCSTTSFSQKKANLRLNHQLAGWNPNSTGFAGFSFNNAGQTDYGWVRLTYSVGANGLPDSMTAIDWAYDSTGNPIQAGQTIAATPEPATAGLAALALGSAGILALRRKRKTA